MFFTISLAEFSLVESLLNGRLKNMDFPAKAKNEFGISNVEYVSMFWKDKVTDQVYLNELKQRTDDLGVRNVLIMVDDEGDLASPEATKRQQAIENHYKWLEAATFLGCHAIRVNLDGEGSDEDLAIASVEGYGQLVEYGARLGVDVIVENHMGPSTNPDWLADVMRQVNNPGAGVLPDFGNFVRRERPESATMESFMNAKIITEYDRYDGVTKLMPFAKGISAKSHNFDGAGNDTDTDFARMLKIIKNADFKGYVGIEYAGTFLKMMKFPGIFPGEEEGIRATKTLLERVVAALL